MKQTKKRKLDPKVALENLKKWDELHGPGNYSDPYRSGNLRSITCVRPKLGGNKFLIVLNSNYETPLSVDKAKTSWDLLFKLAEGMEIQYDIRYKNNIDYFNSNAKNKIYTKGGYKRTKILRIDVRRIVPNIKIEMISKRAFEIRKNKAER